MLKQQVEQLIGHVEDIEIKEAMDIAIGTTRAKLLRSGGLSAERFAELQLGTNFQPLTLDEMRRLEPKAFARAGI